MARLLALGSWRGTTRSMYTSSNSKWCGIVNFKVDKNGVELAQSYVSFLRNTGLAATVTVIPELQTYELSVCVQDTPSHRWSGGGRFDDNVKTRDAAECLREMRNPHLQVRIDRAADRLELAEDAFDRMFGRSWILRRGPPSNFDDTWRRHVVRSSVRLPVDLEFEHNQPMLRSLRPPSSAAWAGLVKYEYDSILRNEARQLHDSIPLGETGLVAGVEIHGRRKEYSVSVAVQGVAESRWSADFADAGDMDAASCLQFVKSNAPVAIDRTYDEIKLGGRWILRRSKSIDDRHWPWPFKTMGWLNKTLSCR